MISRRHLLNGVIGFVDGLNLLMQDPGDPLMQNAFYNGWKCACFASQLLVFAPDGTIIFAIFNAPGSWHDSHMAKRLYELLLDVTRLPLGFALLGDSAFKGNGDFEGRMLVPMRDSEMQCSMHEFLQKLRHHKEVVSCRQAAEWGMRQVQGPWGRLHTILTSNHADRNTIIDCCLRMTNVRARLIGLNQIQSVYYESWNVDEFGRPKNMEECRVETMFRQQYNL